jgi:hypothetical protein
MPSADTVGQNISWEGMKEQGSNCSMHGAFTPGQTREYYKELMDELDRRKTDTI